MLSRSNSVSAFLDSDGDQDCTTIASNTFKIMWSTRRQQIFKLSILINIGFILYLMLRVGVSPTSMDRLHSIVRCNNRDSVARTKQHGDYWVLENYVKADQKPLKCHETVTFTTHATYDYLINIRPLVKRWMAPVSVAVFAPGADLAPAVRSIRYLMDCTGDDLVRNMVSFHIFFPQKHIPHQIPKHGFFPKHLYNCTEKPPFQVINRSATYTNNKRITYPINVARNIAKDAALTHFILAADIELYPSPNMVPKFLNMIARNAPPLCNKNPRVYPIPVFEIDAKYNVPLWKKDLQMMVATKIAFPLKSNVCRKCNIMPEFDKWLADNESVRMDVLAVSKQHQEYMAWQPLFIGTPDDVHFDERLHSTGNKYRSIQGYIFCVKDYDLMILNTAFLCHKPTIKTLEVDDQPRNEEQNKLLQDQQNKFDYDAMLPELIRLYGFRPQCINYKKNFDVT